MHTRYTLTVELTTIYMDRQVQAFTAGAPVELVAGVCGFLAVYPLHPPARIVRWFMGDWSATRRRGTGTQTTAGTPRPPRRPAASRHKSRKRRRARR